MSILNPHSREPVKSGLYCWRLNKASCWESVLYQSEEEAYASATEHCVNRLGVGKHTIHIGITDTVQIQCSELIERYRKHLSLGWEHQDLFYAMGLPQSTHAKTSSLIADSVVSVLNDAAKNSRKTSIKKLKHKYFTVKPSDLGISENTLSELVSALRRQYSSLSTNWVKVQSIQSLISIKAKELINEYELPFVIEKMRIWQGYDRTKDRLHLVCKEPFSDGRFHRLEKEPLCTKAPKIDDSDYSEPVPCLACLDRLLKIESNLNQV